MRSSHAKGFRYAEKCSYGDRPTRLDLLPVSGRKAKSNHILLRIAVTFAEFLNSDAQCAKKVSLINHPFYLENGPTNAHEQISGRLYRSPQLPRRAGS